MQFSLNTSDYAGAAKKNKTPRLFLFTGHYKFSSLEGGLAQP